MRAAPQTDQEVTLALDAMSGDRGFGVVVEAARSILARHPKVRILLVGDQSVLRGSIPAGESRLAILHASEVVQMDESPVDALRKKKHSSMRLAINAVKSGDAHACVSAGNTGALMATAKYVLKTLPGIDRPAIMAEVPAMGGSVHLLDVGANSTCTAAQLYQFAIMGSVVATDLNAIEKPRIALLNIGEEDIKGHDGVREAAALLAASHLNYVGFVEGDDIFSHAADVVVTDGFTGNVALKTMEGTASLVASYLRDAFSSGLRARLQALFARSALLKLRSQLDPRHYNGASFIGLNGIVIKSHGGADAVAFENAIDTALIEVQNNVPAQIARWLESEAA